MVVLIGIELILPHIIYHNRFSGGWLKIQRATFSISQTQLNL